MKRLLLGLVIALFALVLGVIVTAYLDKCKAPWVRCDHSPVKTQRQ